jgi:hypothetical protein
MARTKVPEVLEEHRWPAVIALLSALTLYALLPSSFFPGLRYAVVATGIVALVPLIAINPVRFQRQTVWSRRLSIGQILLLVVANQVALVQLIDQLINSTPDLARGLLLSAAQVWVTNVIVFALMFWELDRGGPVARSGGESAGEHRPSLRFPQEDSPAAPPWRPEFLDYLFTSLWASTAFSPTDAMPLTHSVKFLMAIESVSGLVIFALVVGRAMNLLS